jgi:hypothetical protein
MSDVIEVGTYAELGSAGVPGRMRYVSRSTAAKNGLYKDTGAAWTLVWAEDMGTRSTVGHYGSAPIAQQTGVAVTAAGIHAACVALGLFTA